MAVEIAISAEALQKLMSVVQVNNQTASIDGSVPFECICWVVCMEGGQRFYQSKFDSPATETGTIPNLQCPHCTAAWPEGTRVCLNCFRGMTYRAIHDEKIKGIS